MPDTVKILLVDDHAIVRVGVAQMLAAQPGFQVVGEASSGAQALQKLRDTACDLVLLDLVLGEESGLAVLKRILTEFPQMAVLMLSMHEDRLYAERVVRAGAKGYISKVEATEILVPAIHTVMAGRLHLSEAMRSLMIERMTKPGAGAGWSAMSDLTDRELEILRFIGQGKTTAQIATVLSRSVKTIEAHKSALKTKLNVDSAPELLRAAMQHLGEG